MPFGDYTIRMLQDARINWIWVTWSVGCKCEICRKKFAEFSAAVCGQSLPVPGAKARRGGGETVATAQSRQLADPPGATSASARQPMRSPDTRSTPSRSVQEFSCTPTTTNSPT